MKRNIEYKALDMRVLAVAVEGEVDDWAAYIGAVKGDNHNKEYEIIVHSGTKLPYKIAGLLFPDFDKKLRWRE